MNQKKTTTIIDTSASSDQSNVSTTTQATTESTNYLSKKLDSHQTNIKPRQQYLFFKTPNNEEKKKFDFSNNETINQVINEASKNEK